MYCGSRRSRGVRRAIDLAAHRARPPHDLCGVTGALYDGERRSRQGALCAELPGVPWPARSRRRSLRRSLPDKPADLTEHSLKRRLLVDRPRHSWNADAGTRQACAMWISGILIQFMCASGHRRPRWRRDAGGTFRRRARVHLRDHRTLTGSLRQLRGNATVLLVFYVPQSLPRFALAQDEPAGEGRRRISRCRFNRRRARRPSTRHRVPRSSQRPARAGQLT